MLRKTSFLAIAVAIGAMSSSAWADGDAEKG